MDECRHGTQQRAFHVGDVGDAEVIVVCAPGGFGRGRVVDLANAHGSKFNLRIT
jgi:hypothetical protein